LILTTSTGELGWVGAPPRSRHSVPPNRPTAPFGAGGPRWPFRSQPPLLGAGPLYLKLPVGRCQTVHKHRTNIRRSVACCGHRANATASFESEADVLSPRRHGRPNHRGGAERVRHRAADRVRGKARLPA
jgi:hypothetical protein